MCNNRIFQCVRVIKCVSTPSGLQYSGPQFRIVALSAVLHVCLAIRGKGCYLISLRCVGRAKSSLAISVLSCAELCWAERSELCSWRTGSGPGLVSKRWSTLLLQYWFIPISGESHWLHGELSGTYWAWSRDLLWFYSPVPTVLTRQLCLTAVVHVSVSTDFVLRTWGKELYLEMLTVECRAIDAT